MNDAPRRRRSSEEDSGSGGGGGLPLFPLILVVIFAGLLLGGVLAKFFGGRASPKATPPPQTFTIAPAQSQAPLAMATRAATPRPIPTPTPSGTGKPSEKPSEKPSPNPSASALPSASPTRKPSPKPVPTPSSRVVYVTPAPHRPTQAPNNVFTPSAATPAAASAATPAPNYVPGTSDQAASIVRSYLGALARGDRATATTYLAHGLPSEGFIDANSRIVSIHNENSASPYKVSADVQTSTGEYYITFTLQQGTGGLQIVDHYAIKPQ